MKVPLMDMVAQYHSIRAEIDEAIRLVMESGHFILGPHGAAFEREVADYLGTAHAVGVASGTDALVLALRALGVGAGDEVIVPAYTFFATAEAVMLTGATPVFVDIRPDTFCLDVSGVESAINARTKAIIPVHLYGHPADMTPLLRLAQTRGLKLIEDNAQAFGAEYEGRRTGGLGDVGCLSFFPSKNLGGCGDGGMVVTNDAAVAERIRMLRTHGWKKKYHPELLGCNSRLDELQAAILRAKLKHVAEWNERRRLLAERYAERLADLDVVLPRAAPGVTHAYHLYIVRVKDRARVQQVLSQSDIASAVYYPQPLHLTEPCRALGYRAGDFPESERASLETLALPLYPEMTEEQFEAVCAALARGVARQAAYV